MDDDRGYIKFLVPSETHWGYTYKVGLNICPEPWNEEPCTGGGFYICTRKDLRWAGLYDDIDHYREATIPSDAQIARFEDKVKVDRLILGAERFTLDTLPITENDVFRTPQLMRHMRNLSETFKLRCLEYNPLYFIYIPNPSQSLCEKAVQAYVSNLAYVPDSMKTFEMCRDALQVRSDIVSCIPLDLWCPELEALLDRHRHRRAS